MQIQSLWDRAWESAFLTSSQVKPGSQTTVSGETREDSLWKAGSDPSKKHLVFLLVNPLLVMLAEM